MFWEELTGDQFPGAVQTCQGVCLLPLSCIERHGHHLPLGTDMLIGREICRRVAVLEPAVIFPNFIFTQILEARAFPGTIGIDMELVVRLLDNVCREIARNGLKKIVLVNAHGGNYYLMHFFGQMQLNSPRDYAVYAIQPGFTPEDEAALKAQWQTTVDGHAGESETSQILTLRPDLVDKAKLPTNDEGMPLGRLKSLGAAGAYTGIWWYADHPTHYRGDGRPATAEKGELELDAHARSVANAIRLIKQDTETKRLQDEFFALTQAHG
jgi:creatinine amidohydrolase